MLHILHLCLMHAVLMCCISHFTYNFADCKYFLDICVPSYGKYPAKWYAILYQICCTAVASIAWHCFSTSSGIGSLYADVLLAWHCFSSGCQYADEPWARPSNVGTQTSPIPSSNQCTALHLVLFQLHSCAIQPTRWHASANSVAASPPPQEIPSSILQIHCLICIYPQIQWMRRARPSNSVFGNRRGFCSLIRRANQWCNSNIGNPHIQGRCFQWGFTSGRMPVISYSNICVGLSPRHWDFFPLLVFLQELGWLRWSAMSRQGPNQLTPFSAADQNMTTSTIYIFAVKIYEPNPFVEKFPSSD